MARGPARPAAGPRPGRQPLSTCGQAAASAQESAESVGKMQTGFRADSEIRAANQLELVAEGGLGNKCAVAGLVWVSDASFGGQNMPWHGVYCVKKPSKTCNCM